MDELTLGLTIETLDAQSVPCASRRIIARLSPMCASFNAALDFALAERADILFHTASDVVAEPFALQALLEKMNLDENYLIVGRGFDIINGDQTSVGLWIFNMHVFGSEYRFRDIFKQDLDLCERVEQATGKTRSYAGFDRGIGYHHPIWTPKEMYLKFRYGTQKYSESKIISFERFFERELSYNPENKVLLAGKLALEKSRREPHRHGSKDNPKLEEEFLEATGDLYLDGSEYYVYHQRFKRIAKRLLNSYRNCVTIEERV